MAKKGKTNKTAAKRFKQTNPKGNKDGKYLYKKDKHHGLTKEDARTKNRRKNKSKVATKGYNKNLKRLINN